MNESENNKFLTVEEVASMLRKKERTIREWCYSRTIPHYKVGNSLLFKLEEILNWISKYCCVEIMNIENGSKETLKRKSLDSKPPRLQAKNN